MAVSGRDLPPEDIHWIARLFRYGFSWRKIQKTTGFSSRTIAKYRPRKEGMSKAAAVEDEKKAIAK